MRSLIHPRRRLRQRFCLRGTKRADDQAGVIDPERLAAGVVEAELATVDFDRVCGRQKSADTIKEMGLLNLINRDRQNGSETARGSSRGDTDQAGRIMGSDRAEHDRIGEREQGGIGTDPKGQRHDRRCRKAWILT